MKRRVLFIVLDSLGCGGAEDAAKYGDEGADTLGHIAAACAAGKANGDGLRQGALRMPVLAGLGLGEAAAASSGAALAGLGCATPAGLWGYAVERSAGKDTPSGHWELAGTKVPFAFGYFPPGEPAFPRELIADIVAKGKLPGILGDTHASGIAIIDVLGEEHLATGKPILYTSTDSVLQIAAHEEAFGLQRLYDLCEIVRELVNSLHIGRVIARPFLGTDRSNFKRTPRRKDYALQPPAGNILDRAAEAGRAIVSIGKIGDIFAHRNTGREIKGAGDMDLFDRMLREWDALPDGGLMFANFVDLDTDFGHRRNVAGYAAGLEGFDRRMVELTPRLRAGDLVVFSADHGNDPVWPGTDHTREHVPLLAFGPDIASGSIGRRETFADAGATIAKYLNVKPTVDGTAFL
ncbi:MAG: phosphopentomutase [Beijerinckiaceae bacterium]